MRNPTPFGIGFRPALPWFGLIVVLAGCGNGGSFGSNAECDSQFDCAPGHSCVGGRCVSDSQDGGGNVTSDGEICGDGLDNNGNGRSDEGCVCVRGASQACFPGTPQVAGLGACTFGQQTCVAPSEFGVWSECMGHGEQSAESCDEVDNDCDGTVDEGCACTPGSQRPCGSQNNQGACRDGVQTCVLGDSGVSEWGTCEGGVSPGIELCDGQDRDCDGTDNSCRCTVGETKPCDDYRGPPSSRGVGACKDGIRRCVFVGPGQSDWSACEGQVTPGAELCDGADRNCNGQVDCADLACRFSPACCTPATGCLCSAGQSRVCASGGLGACLAGSQTCMSLANGTTRWSECRSSTTPGAETCDGNTDTDCDGLVGCADPDCQAFPSCCTPVSRTASLAVQEADVLIVLDRSASMKNRKFVDGTRQWDAAQAALSAVLPEVDGLVRFGLTLFPDPDPNAGVCTAPETVQLAPRLDASGAILQIIASAPPTDGSTPTSQIIGVAERFFSSTTSPRPRFALLVTDGDPTCRVGKRDIDEAAFMERWGVTSSELANYNVSTLRELILKLNNSGAVLSDRHERMIAEYERLVYEGVALEETEEAMRRLTAMGIPTFVLGIFGDDLRDTTRARLHTALNALAVAGGRPRTGTTKYFPANSQANLAESLRSVVAAMSDCTFDLGRAPTRPELGTVSSNGSIVPQSTTDGWSVSGPTLRLNGSWCQRIRDGRIRQVEVNFPCQ